MKPQCIYKCLWKGCPNMISIFVGKGYFLMGGGLYQLQAVDMGLIKNSLAFNIRYCDLLI